MKKNKVIEVKCPTCEKKFNYYGSEFRPFCSERCKMIDLGKWFQEDYTIASKEPLADEDIDKVARELNLDEEF